MREVANHSGAMRPYATNKKFGWLKQPAQEVAARWQRLWSLAWLRMTPLQSQRDDLLNEIALLCARAALARVTTLLTRLWDSATWVSRGEILRAARPIRPMANGSKTP